MTVVAEQYTYVVGADTHARTHTYAVVEAATGRLTGQATFPASGPGMSRALAWIAREAPGPVLAAVEGTGSYGAGLNAALKKAGIPVAEAPPETGRAPPRQVGCDRCGSRSAKCPAAARRAAGHSPGGENPRRAADIAGISANDGLTAHRRSQRSDRVDEKHRSRC